MSATQDHSTHRLDMIKMHLSQLEGLILDLEFESEERPSGARIEASLRELKDLYGYLPKLSRCHRESIMAAFNLELQSLVTRCRIQAGRLSHSETQSVEQS